MTALLSRLRLTLFFTDGLSLTEWERLGLLERETALYKALRPHLGGVTLVTYGDGRDLAYRDRLDGIEVVCNRWRLSPHWYWRQLAAIPGRWRLGSVVFKSNQMPGADTALALARRFHKPFLARCGYLHGQAMQRRHGSDSPEARRALARERMVFQGADRVVVTTAAMAEVVTGLHDVPVERVRVIPNYVDVERFAPRSGGRPASGVPQVLFVGRLDVQKNPLILVEALAGVAAELCLVGEGPLRADLLAAAQRHGVALRLLGVQPHGVLPELMNAATLFVLPSPLEGHPKTLLEAMACGLAVVGFRDASGVREVIRHQETGWLCEQTVEGLRDALVRLLGDAPLRERLGRQARAWAVEHVALERIVALELDLLAELLEMQGVREGG